ncbi:MAG: peptidylprolyl isomerase [Dysgonomonas sp.]
MKQHLFFLIFTLFSMSMCNQKPKENIIVLETNYGNIKVKLYNETPLHRDNFLKLATDSSQPPLFFHRIIKEFMIQAGEYPPSDSSPAIHEEITGIYPTYFHKRGALGAAHWDKDRNPDQNSESKQFYIITGRRFYGYELEDLEKKKGIKYTDQQREVYKTVGGSPHLDGEYTIFGEVIGGMDIIDKIERAATDENDKPLQEIRIIKISILN